MQAGLGALRLAPHVFWAMTPRELDAALKGAFGFATSPPMSRGELSVLMAAYPDQITSPHTGEGAVRSQAKGSHGRQ